IKQVAIDLNRFKRTSSRTRLSRTFSTGTIPKQTPAVNGFAGVNPSGIRQKLLPWVITIGVIVCTAAVFFLLRSQLAGSGSSVSRVNIAVLNSPEQQIVHTDIPSMTLSPDGKYFVYTISEKGSSKLFIRSINSFQGIPIKGTENGTSPFFSPDGQWIGFTADGKIKKVPTTGGAVELICDVGGFRGATWGTDNRIYFSAGYSTGLSSVMSNGSDLKEFSSMDSTHKDRTHRWPQFIRDGKWVLYTIGDMSSPNSYVDALLVMQSTETGEKHVLDVRGEMARYVEPGYLVVARNGSLLAAPFSLKDFRVSRPLSVVVSDVNCDPGSGNTDFTISDNGQLVYLNGTMNKDLELVWVSRDGNVTAVPTSSQPFNTPRISPDGKKLALSIGINTANDNDIWIYDLAKNVFNRLTFTKRMFAPLWNTDGRSIYYANSASGSEGLMMQAADGSTAPTSLVQNVVPRYPISISPNGKQLIFNTVGGPTGEGSILILDRDKGNAVTPLISGRGYFYGGSISPDGRYIVYGSSETGTLEAYVQTYPDLKGKWQISLNGGIGPMWSPTGNEIFFVNSVGKMMSVSVKTTPSFMAEKPKELFDVSAMYFPNIPINNFDVSSDGKKFIMLRNSTSNSKMTSFNYVVNWLEELEKIN
ncbi:MAG: TolB family protein, partial [Bacteroidota bacterium]